MWLTNDGGFQVCSVPTKASFVSSIKIINIVTFKHYLQVLFLRLPLMIFFLDGLIGICSTSTLELMSFREGPIPELNFFAIDRLVT